MVVFLSLLRRRRLALQAPVTGLGHGYGTRIVVLRVDIQLLAFDTGLGHGHGTRIAVLRLAIQLLAPVLS